MYNKLKFNNLLISSKKQIEKGRAQVIQKCVQKVRKLKILTEKSPQNKRHEQCLRKTLINMEHLKKLKAIDIIKGVLLMNKPATAFLTNGRATVEEVAVALLSTNKIVKTIIERFKVELNLDENEQSWRNQLQENSKRRAKIERTEEKRRRRKEQKDQKSLSRKRQEWLEDNNTQQNEDTETPNTTNGIWKEEIIKEEVEVPATTNTKVIKEQKTVAAKNMKKNKQVKNLVKKTVDPINNMEILETHPRKTTVSESKREEHTEEDEKTTHVVDAFFITKTGENYLSTAVVKNHNPDENSEYVDKSYGHDRRNTIIGLHRKSHDFNHENTRYNGNRERFPQRQRVQTQIPDASENKLHPSWEAKQRFKPIINNFQGKRITFDDASVPKKNVPKKTESTDEKLHPSWAAKQKLKPVITAFQGKKIVFE